MKICPKCHRKTDDYQRDRSRRDGLFRICRDCAHAEKSERRERYQARYHVARLVRKGLLPSLDKLQCAVKGCTRRPEYHHFLGWEPEHWASVIPVCRRHNMLRFHEMETML